MVSAAERPAARPAPRWPAWAVRAGRGGPGRGCALGQLRVDLERGPGLGRRWRLVVHVDSLSLSSLLPRYP